MLVVSPNAGTEPLLDLGALDLKKNIYIYILLLYICVLILSNLFNKITFCFSLTILFILLRVMLYSQAFL